MKKAMAVLFVFVLCTACVFSVELGIRVGHGTILENTTERAGLTLLAGFDVGLTKRLELNVEVMTPVVPDPFSRATAGFEFGYSILDDRSRDNGYAGNALNTTVSLGLFASDNGSDGRYLPTYLTFRITPLTLGTTASGRRENFMPIGLAWNFRENSLSLFMGVIMYDHYLDTEELWAR